jgi:enterochelin esterase-like enzyme
MVLVCPYMPNPHAFPGGSGAMFARYVQWLRDAVLPAVRERVPGAVRSREGTGMAGVSLGGYAALELASRAPETFSTVATVQGAFSAASAPNYARRLAELESPALRGVYVSTSWYDPYRVANERLYEALVQRGVPSRFSLRRGPHSQGWLREIGTAELLLWQDRALRTKLETGAIRAPKP